MCDVSCFDALARVPSVAVHYIYRARPLGDYAAVVLPGSKNVAGDLGWLRQSGLFESVLQYHRAGGKLVGICGGLQMLGSRIVDADGVESSERDVDARTIRQADARTTIGFFQLGGGIAGDFPICVVPMIHQDMRRAVPYWGYFCQIGDSTTSYGSYSGAFPTEKITWGKLDVDTPMFMIESDATIVAPLMFAYILGW